MNTIIPQLNSQSREENIVGMIRIIPIKQLEAAVRETEKHLRDKLEAASESIRLSMDANRSQQIIADVRAHMTHIDTYLQYTIRSQLSWRQQLYFALQGYFKDEEEYKEKMEESLKRLEKYRQDITRYNGTIDFNYTEFEECLTLYQQWIQALTTFAPSLDTTDSFSQDLFYKISQLISRNGEYIHAQLQLDNTIAMQKNNNQNVCADILHLTAMSKSLVNNAVSIKEFFKEQYVGSKQRLKKYR